MDLASATSGNVQAAQATVRRSKGTASSKIHGFRVRMRPRGGLPVRPYDRVDEEGQALRSGIDAGRAKLAQELRGIDLRLAQLADPHHQIDLLGLQVEAIQRSFAPLDLNSSGNRLQIATIIARYELTSRERDLLRRKVSILSALREQADAVASPCLD